MTLLFSALVTWIGLHTICVQTSNILVMWTHVTWFGSVYSNPLDVHVNQVRSTVNAK